MLLGRRLPGYSLYSHSMQAAAAVLSRQASSDEEADAAVPGAPNFGLSLKLSSFSINPADQSRMHSVRSILQPPRGT